MPLSSVQNEWQLCHRDSGRLCVYLPPCTPNWSVRPVEVTCWGLWVNSWSVSVIVKAEKQSWGMWPLTWFISSVRIGSMCYTHTNVTHKFQTISFPKHTPVKFVQIYYHTNLYTRLYICSVWTFMQTLDYRHIKWAETQCKGPAPTPSVC